MRAENRGMLVGFVGIVIFSLTLPTVKIAIEVFSPWFIAFGRAALAGSVAACWLLVRRAPLPARADLPGYALTACGIVWGFPVFMNLALVEGSSAHGAVVLGILPLVTTLLGVLRTSERPSLGFWMMALLGSALVLAYAMLQSSGALTSVDLLLLLACLAAATGYTEGTRLSQRTDPRLVISWILAMTLPVNLALSLYTFSPAFLTANPAQWLSFAYNGLFSMFIGFFFWYEGLATGGIARVSQVQLLQPFCTLLAGWLVLGEALTLINLGFALAVVGVVFAGRKLAVRR